MEVLRIAAGALSAHKLRSFLTLLGVIIGVMTVVTVVSIISGLNNYIKEQVIQLKPDVYVVTQFGIITSREQFLEAIKRKKIDLVDYELVRSRCRSCAMVAASQSTRSAVKRGSNRLNSVDVVGGTSNYAEIQNFDLDAGRSFTRSEDHHSAPVAVIGSDVRDEIFGKLDPIGRTIWVGNMPMKVIGLIKKQGAVFGESQDKQLIMPLSTYRKRFGARRSLNLFIRAEGGVPGIEKSQDEVRVLIRNRRKTPFRGDDPFGLVSAEAVQAVWKRISANAFALMLFISSISLVVGGIVIMNIMLVSVVERTREIGIRRALGATRSNVLMQFLTEAVLLSMGGGLMGVLVGSGIAKIVSTVAPLPTRVTPVIVFAGLAISAVTGMLAGIVPAVRASKLPTIDALRYE